MLSVGGGAIYIIIIGLFVSLSVIRKATTELN